MTPQPEPGVRVMVADTTPENAAAGYVAILILEDERDGSRIEAALSRESVGTVRHLLAAARDRHGD